MEIKKLLRKNFRSSFYSLRWLNLYGSHVYGAELARTLGVRLYVVADCLTFVEGLELHHHSSSSPTPTSPNAIWLYKAAFAARLVQWHG